MHEKTHIEIQSHLRIDLGKGCLDKILDLVKSRWWDLSGSLTMAPKIHPSLDLDRKFATTGPKQTFHKTLWIPDCGLGFNKTFYGLQIEPNSANRGHHQLCLFS